MTSIVRRDLAAGPGPSVRWPVAIVLILLGIVGVPLGRLALHEWIGAQASNAWRRKFPMLDLPERPFLEELGGSLGTYGTAYLPMLVLTSVLLLVFWQKPQYWRRLALVVSIPAALSTTIIGPLGKDELTGFDAMVAHAAPVWSVLTVALSWALGWLAERVLTRPLASDVAGTGVNVSVRLRNSKARLVVDADRLRLVGLPRPSELGAPRCLSIPFGRLAVVQAGTLQAQGFGTPWPLPNGVNIPLTDGPALRVVGNEQQWLLPLDDAETIDAFVSERRSRRTAVRPTAPPSREEWQQARARMQREHKSQQARRLRTVGGGSQHIFLVGAGLLMTLTVASFVVNDGLNKLWGALFFGVFGIGAFAAWVSLDRAARVTEEWPRPPDSGPWGEVDPARAPIAGWLTS